MRLIDADVFDAIINDDGTIDVYATETARNAMLIMPTVDAVPVIRCKDCKNSDPWYADERRCFLWSENGISVFDDGFCNYAERRTDETD